MSESSKDHETSSEQGNAGRRRLVRGAMALAPLVLTLRSGGLAAASAGAAVVAFGTLDTKGNITNISLTDPGRTVTNSDKCVTGYSRPNNDFRISGGQADTKAIHGSFKCGDAKAVSDPVQVAILSSNATISL